MAEAIAALLQHSPYAQFQRDVKQVQTGAIEQYAKGTVAQVQEIQALRPSGAIESGFVNRMALRGTQPALNINWCELIVTRQGDGKILYENAFITRHELTEASVPLVTFRLPADSAKARNSQRLFSRYCQPD